MHESGQSHLKDLLPRELQLVVRDLGAMLEKVHWEHLRIVRPDQSPLRVV